MNIKAPPTTLEAVPDGRKTFNRARRRKAAEDAPGVEMLVYRKADVCRALGNINKSTLERMVHRGEFPAADVSLGRAIGWRVDTVKAWLDRQSAIAMARKGGRA